jgi:hypothetical protein
LVLLINVYTLFSTKLEIRAKWFLLGNEGMGEMEGVGRQGVGEGRGQGKGAEMTQTYE